MGSDVLKTVTPAERNLFRLQAWLDKYGYLGNKE